MHQVEHMKNTYLQKGIVFLMIRFKTLDEVIYCHILSLNFSGKIYSRNQKSITVEEIRKNGYHIPYQYQQD